MLEKWMCEVWQAEEERWAEEQIRKMMEEEKNNDNHDLRD